ncbi:DUF1107 family protein [Gallaecimonas sp. GXIMD4217]|uniref:DUF1107 family protein n=1 Tax=Gallaecimonas sp. GXIMD4217 TaxID=3131927 RepID=UPI00311AF7CE
MRKFPKYNPKQIAKHITAFYEGVIWIKTVGAFRFAGGRLLQPKARNEAKLRVVSEVNRLLDNRKAPSAA